MIVKQTKLHNSFLTIKAKLISTSYTLESFILLKDCVKDVFTAHYPPQTISCHMTIPCNSIYPASIRVLSQRLPIYSRLLFFHRRQGQTSPFLCPNMTMAVLNHVLQTRIIEKRYIMIDTTD